MTVHSGSIYCFSSPSSKRHPSQCANTTDTLIAFDNTFILSKRGDNQVVTTADIDVWAKSAFVLLKKDDTARHLWGNCADIYFLSYGHYIYLYRVKCSIILFICFVTNILILISSHFIFYGNVGLTVDVCMNDSRFCCEFFCEPKMCFFLSLSILFFSEQFHTLNHKKNGYVCP